MKKANISLTDELNKKCNKETVMKPKEGRSEAPTQKNELCRNKDRCEYWKQNRCQFQHLKEYETNSSKETGQNQQKKQTENVTKQTMSDTKGDKREVERRTKMCKDGKRCTKIETCESKHNCNFRACKKRDDCLYIHTEENKIKDLDINAAGDERKLCKKGKMCSEKGNLWIHTYMPIFGVFSWRELSV